MKILGILNPYKFTEEQIKLLPVHKKVRAVVFVDPQTLVCVEEEYNGKRILGLPGGAVEDFENEESAICREVKEETGCDIGTLKEIGAIQLIRKNYISETKCYFANANHSNSDPVLTDKEKRAGTTSIKITFDEAVSRIAKENKEFPNDSSYRSIIMLDEVQKLLKINQIV